MGKIVDLTFRLKDQVTDPMRKINFSLGQASKQWQRAGRDIQKTGRSISRVGSSMTKSLTVPLAAAGTAAVTKFAEVDKTMTLVESTMGKTKFATADLGDAMEKAAMNSTYSMEEAAQAALNYARGGMDAEEASAALAPAMNLAAGAGGDLDEVSQGLMATLNSFGADVMENAAHYADVFAAACNNSALDVNSLSSAMSVASPIFKASGATVEDAALAMGIMANAGVDANKAANSLKTGVARLASPTKEAAEAMEALGIEAFDSEGNLKDMSVLQGELSDAFDGLTGKEQEAAAAAIFGKNQMAPWLSLIQASPKDVKELTASLEDCNDLTTKMADDMMGGFGGSLEKLKSSVDVLATSLGENLAPYISLVSDKIQKAVDKFNSLDDSQKDLIVRVGLVVAAIGPALLVFGTLVTNIGGAIRTVGDFGRALQRAGGIMGMLSSPGAIVVGVLAALVAVGILVWKNWDKISAAIQKVNNFFKEHQTLAAVLVVALGALGVAIGAYVITANAAAIGTLALNAALGAASVVGGIATGVMGAFGAVIAFITSPITLIILAIGALVAAGVALYKNWDTVKEKANDLWNGLKEAFGQVAEFIGGQFENAVTNVKAAINSMISFVNSAINKINGISVDIPDWVPEWGGKTFSLDIPTIPALATGTQGWRGGIVQVSEKGGEIIDLPRGSRVYPHDESVQRAYADGRNSRSGDVHININIPSMSVRSQDDIYAISAEIVNQAKIAFANAG